MSSRRPETPEQSEFRAEVRAWLAENKPAPPDFVLPQSFLEVATRQQFDYLRAWQQKVYAAGYLGFDVAKEYGGQGIDKHKRRIVGQEMSRASTPFMVNLIGLQWAGPTVLTYGTEAQKKRLIPPMLAAEEIWCQGFSEPSAGSDLASLQTRAVAREDGEGWLVTGHKVWTTIAHFSKWMILIARTDPDADTKYAGLSYFVFPMDVEGVTVQPLVKMTREGGFNQVILDEAPMPADSLLGELGQGWKVAMTTLMFERGAATGAGHERAEEDAKALLRLLFLAHQVKRDGRPSAHDPVFRDRIAQLMLEAESMRQSAARMAVPELCADYPQALPMSFKIIYSEFLQRLTKLACDMLGPQAILWMEDANARDDAEWPRGRMNSYGFTIGGGTSEILRNIVGERVLGLPKSK